jgi:glycyl-tRNA synthetase beta chain
MKKPPAKKPAPRAEFFLEVGSEEIPASMIPKALQELKVLLEKYLGLAGLLQEAKIEVLGGPRRLAAKIDGVLLRQRDTEKEITGPLKSAAFDLVGNPTRAAQGFAAKQDVPVDKLYIRATPRGEYVAAKQVIPGRPGIEILNEALPRVLQEIPWSKSMRWSATSDGAGPAKTGPRFIRPVRWIVALLGGRVVPFSFGGVRADKKTNGHRFLGSEGIPVSSSTDYRAKLRKNFVLADPAERRAKIEQELSALTRKNGLRIHPDSGLLEQVTYLNEYPSAILGDFDPGFLQLPKEILITVMRDHQKYFAVEKKNGDLAPHFVAIINLDRDAGGHIQRGHERVLRARFADARFFWDSDQKCRRADIDARLAQVVYESKLGSYADKVGRMHSLGIWLAKQWAADSPTLVFRLGGPGPASVASVDRAISLSKCDLVTSMVREFPELQGVVGGLYARAQGEQDEIAYAIYDHYLPLSLEDEIPRNLTGCIVALADKLDALAGCFAVGRIPSGSSDPFALRRAATGIVKILLECKLSLSLHAAIHAAFQILHKQNSALKATPGLEKQLGEFILDRARFVFQQRLGFAYDEVNAVFASGADDLLDAADRLAAVKALRLTTNFEPLAASFKRIRNILEKAGPQDSWHAAKVDPELFREEAEAALYSAAGEAAREASEHKQARHYREALVRISNLRPAVDKFFDEVLVMADDESIRKNRLTLLANLLNEFSNIADFSEIVTEGK